MSLLMGPYPSLSLFSGKSKLPLLFLHYFSLKSFFQFLRLKILLVIILASLYFFSEIGRNIRWVFYLYFFSWWKVTTFFSFWRSLVIQSSPVCKTSFVSRLPFMHAFSELRCILKVLTLVDQTKMSISKMQHCNAENACRYGMWQLVYRGCWLFPTIWRL